MTIPEETTLLRVLLGEGDRFKTSLLVAAAGALGTLFRYAFGGWLARTNSVLPWETLVVNALGCLAIGIVAGALDRGAVLHPAQRIALMAGLIGGFTTFSTFALEAVHLAAGGQWTAATLYALATNLGGFAAVWIGYRAVTWAWIVAR